MARMIKDGSLRGQKAFADSVSKAPSKTLIIPAKDLVQVFAKVLLNFFIVLFDACDLRCLLLLEF